MSDPTGLPEQTGPQEGRCGAIRKRDADGNPIRWCRKYPRRGQVRCEDCGGSSPQALAAAERRLAEAELVQHLDRFGIEVDTTPEEALQRQLRITAGNVAYSLLRVQDLEPDALIWGRTSEHVVEASQFPGVDTTREAVPHVWLVTYERHLKLHLAVVEMALKHNLGERMVRLAERQMTELVELLRGVLADLGHDPADPDVRRIVTSRLRALNGGAA